MNRTIAALVALALPLQPLAAAQPLLASQLSAIDTAATKALRDSGAPSVSIAVVKDGEVVLTRAWG